MTRENIAEITKIHQDINCVQGLAVSAFFFDRKLFIVAKSLTSVNSLLSAIKRRSVEIAKQADKDSRKSLEELFVEALHLSVREYIDVDDFEDYVIINFIIKAHKQGYAVNEMRSFLSSLKNESC